MKLFTWSKDIDNSHAELQYKIVVLENRLWKIEHPPKFKTGEVVKFYFTAHEMKEATIVKEEFEYDRNGLINRRNYLVIIKDYTTLMSEHSLFNKND